MPREFRHVVGRGIVSCFTVVQQLDTAEPFTALSYVWGDAKDTLPIMLNNKVVQVTKNLATALRHIEHHRSQRGIRVFWVDALCINQEDNSEKSHQVQMMGDIYRKATQVFAWLGRPTRVTCLLLDWIPLMIHEFEEFYQSWYPDLPDQSLHEDIEKLSQRQPIPPHRRFTISMFLHYTFISNSGRYKHIRLLKEFARICGNQYWTRVWVLQEMSNKNLVTIFLGCHFMDLPYIHRFCLIIGSFSQYLSGSRLVNGQSPSQLRHPPRYDYIWTDAAQATVQPKKAVRLVRLAGKAGLFVLLSSSKGFDVDYAALQSTKPEDNIFALLGLADDVLDLKIIPDYSKGVRDVYIETASSILLRHQDLDILSYCKFPKHIGALPSWVPDWSMRLTASPLSELCPYTGWLACQERASHDAIIDGPNLIITGVFVDTVQAVLQAKVWNGIRNIDKQFYRFITSALSFIHPHINGTSQSLTAADRTFEALYHVYLSPESLTPPTQRQYAFPEFVQDCRAVVDWHTTSDDIPDYMESISRLVHFWHSGRRVFATTRGFVGMGPEYVQEGDVVVILHGGRIPFLLRPTVDKNTDRTTTTTQKGHNCYELVGETYMYGMMEGQFLWSNPPTQRFTLV